MFRWTGLVAFSLMTALSASMSVAATAETPSSQMSCEVIVIAEDIPDGYYQTTFSMPAESGSHGGEMKTIAVGMHTVTVNADGRWLGATWTRGLKQVARAVTVKSDPQPEHRVMILFDPSKDGEQVSIGCSP